jgi:hypothetical protein
MGGKHQKEVASLLLRLLKIYSKRSPNNKRWLRLLRCRQQKSKGEVLLTDEMTKGFFEG